MRTDMLIIVSTYEQQYADGYEGGSGIDSRERDWQPSRDPFRMRGLSEIVIFAPHKESQGVDFLESITEKLLKFFEGNHWCGVLATNR